MALGLNELLPLTAKADPPTATIVWLTSNSSVATVDGTGRVTGVSVGTATITAASKDMSVRSSCTVTVYDMNSASIPLVGGAPVQLGDTASLSGATMAVDPDNGTIYVAYANNTGAGLVFKSLLGSGIWTQVGTAFAPSTSAIPISADRAHNISLAVNQGVPYVAYLEGGSGNVSQVKKFDGSTSWVTLTGTFASTGAASYLSLAFDSSNNPFLGEIDAAGTNRAFLFGLNSGNWGSIGPGSLGFSNPNSSSTSVAFDSSGRLSGGTGDDYFVAHNDGTLGGRVNTFPTGATFSDQISSPFTSLVIANGVMYVAYQDGPGGTASVHIEHPAPDVDSATHPMSTTRADYVSLAVDPRNGTAYVAYADSTSASPTAVISSIRAGTSSGLPGTVLVNIGDYKVDAITLAFYVDSTGHGHLFACYGIKGTAPSNGGLVVKEYAR